MAEPTNNQRTPGIPLPGLTKHHPSDIAPRTQENDGGATAPWRKTLALVETHLAFTRRTLHAGDLVQSAGGRFNHLQLLRFGAIKTLAPAPNGCQQLAGLHLKGDWIGFDGIATGQHACDGLAMDTSEVWALPYGTLLQAMQRVPELGHALLSAMGGQLTRDREWRFALSNLPADVRLADFLRSWARALAQRELRTDPIRLPLTRAEIGNYLGMTLETVSRSFTRLARLGLIRFEDKGRRHFAITELDALTRYKDNPATIAA